VIAFGPALNGFQDVARQWPDEVRLRLQRAAARAAAGRRAVESPGDALAYQRRLREAFWAGVGGLPAAGEAPRGAAFEEQGALTHLGVRISRLTYDSWPGVPVSALLYRPHSAPGAPGQES
jgi:hypothetical protein